MNAREWRKISPKYGLPDYGRERDRTSDLPRVKRNQGIAPGAWGARKAHEQPFTWQEWAEHVESKRKPPTDRRLTWRIAAPWTSRSQWPKGGTQRAPYMASRPPREPQGELSPCRCGRHAIHPDCPKHGGR